MRGYTVSTSALKSGRFVMLIVCVLMVTAVLLASQPASANSPVFTVIYPTGVFPDDVNNVQAALNLGGIVFLRAVNQSGQPTAFNFGPPVFLGGDPRLRTNGVNLNVDVNIIGEQVGGQQTTIQGGLTAIIGLVPVKSKILGIDFEGPLSSAITLIDTAGTEIAGNTIHAVVPIRVRVPSGQIITFADGIDLFGDTPEGISGKVRIAGNKIRDLTADFSNGIQIDTAAAEFEIAGNSFQNISSNGIAVVRTDNSVSVTDNTIVMSLPFGDGIIGYQAHGSVLIKHNSVFMSSPDVSGGIFINGDRDALYEVVDNTVVCDGIFPDGIGVAGGDATFTDGNVGAIVRHNHITMHNSLFGGVSLYDLVTNTLVQDNEIDGDAANALRVSTFGPPTNIASLNRFIDNNTENFGSSMADVFLDVNSENNVIMGECKSVLDLGTGNSVTCRTDSAEAPAVGTTSAETPMLAAPAASSALTRKKQMLQMFNDFHGRAVMAPPL